MAIQAERDTVAEVVAGLRAHLREAGDAANVTFEADTQLVEGLRTRATVRQFEFGIDEPPSLGGTDTAPNPVEMVLAALGTCQEIVYATYARVLGVPVDGVRIKVAGDLDPRGFYGVADVPAGFKAVRFEVEIDSPASAEDVSRLVETVNAHCPVLDILQRPLPVEGTYALNGQPLA